MIAIAITLLVLEIAVPAEEFSDLWEGIADQWPSHLGYATSFLTIRGVWLADHGLFRRLRYADTVLIRLNLLLLMIIAFLPLPTRLMAEAVDMGASEGAAVLFYGATLFSISVLITAMGRYAASHSSLAVEGERGGIAALAQLTAPHLAFYVALIPVAIFVPTVAVFGLLAVGLSLTLRSRGVGPTAEAGIGTS